MTLISTALIGEMVELILAPSFFTTVDYPRAFPDFTRDILCTRYRHERTRPPFNSDRLYRHLGQLGISRGVEEGARPFRVITSILRAIYWREKRLRERYLQKARNQVGSILKKLVHLCFGRKQLLSEFTAANIVRIGHDNFLGEIEAMREHYKRLRNLCGKKVQTLITSYFVKKRCFELIMEQLFLKIITAIMVRMINSVLSSLAGLSAIMLLMTSLTTPKKLNYSGRRRRSPCLSMPWIVWLALMVLWGVCWMFYPLDGDCSEYSWFTNELNFGQCGMHSIEI